jgi:hypothetical protein
MVYAGLAMLGLALAAIAMVLLAPQRGDAAEQHDRDRRQDLPRDSTARGPADPAAQPGS